MSLADLHIHTYHSADCRSSLKAILRRARERQLSVIALTDHNYLIDREEVADLARRYEIEIIYGEEITTKDKHHIIGLYLTNLIPRRSLTDREVISAIHAQGGLALIPHPLQPGLGVGIRNLRKLLKDPDKSVHPDAIEVLHAFPPQLRFGERLEEFCSKWNLANVGASDAHISSMVGSCYTKFHGFTADDLRLCLKARTTQAGGTGWSVTDLLRYSLLPTEYKLRKLFRRTHGSIA